MASAPVLKVKDPLAFLLVTFLMFGHRETIAARELAHHTCSGNQHARALVQTTSTHSCTRAHHVNTRVRSYTSRDIHAHMHLYYWISRINIIATCADNHSSIVVLFDTDLVGEDHLVTTKLALGEDCIEESE